MHGKLKGTN